MNGQSRLIRSETFLIILLYTISNFPLLFNDGMYIDDWAMFHNPEGVRLNSYGNGRPLAGLLFSFANLFSNPGFIYRIIAFTTFLLSAFVFREIIKRFKFIGSGERTLFVLFYALLPLCHDSRMIGALLLYYFCYFVFTVGLWLLIVSIERKSLLLRLLTLPLFFFSFTTKSLVFFHVLVPVLILYIHQWPAGLKGKITILLRYADLLLVPIIFWVIHKKYFPVSLNNQGYNEVTTGNILISPYSILITFQSTFIGLFEQLTGVLTRSTFMLVFAAAIYFFLLKKVHLVFPEKTHEEKTGKLPKPVFFILTGLAIFIIGSIPYALVNKIPGFVSTMTRLQILFQFAVSLMIIGSVELLFTAKFKRHVYLLLLSSFVVTGMYYHLRSELWWYKSLSILENLKTNEVIRDHTTFLVRDNVLKQNATTRMYDGYEYNGMMKYVYGDQKRYAVNENKVLDSTTLALMMTEPQMSSIKDYQKHDFEYIISINQGSYRVGAGNENMDILRTFTLMVTRLTNHDKFMDKIRNIVVLRTEPHTQGLFEQR